MAYIYHTSSQNIGYFLFQHHINIYPQTEMETTYYRYHGADAHIITFTLAFTEYVCVEPSRTAYGGSSQRNSLPTERQRPALPPSPPFGLREYTPNICWDFFRLAALFGYRYRCIFQRCETGEAYSWSRRRFIDHDRRGYAQHTSAYRWLYFSVEISRGAARRRRREDMMRRRHLPASCHRE